MEERDNNGASVAVSLVSRFFDRGSEKVALSLNLNEIVFKIPIKYTVRLLLFRLQVDAEHCYLVLNAKFNTYRCLRETGIVS